MKCKTFTNSTKIVNSVSKKFIVLIPLFISLISFSQTEEFLQQTQKTKQSYLDRGYKLVDYTGDTLVIGEPLVTPMLDFDYNTLYIVLVQIDGCVYCNYDLNFVDDREYLFPVEYETITENGTKEGMLKFMNEANKAGKYVLFLDSDLPYFANIFVFKKN